MTRRQRSGREIPGSLKAVEPASLQTINGATTPRRRFAEQITLRRAIQSRLACPKLVAGKPPAQGNTFSTGLRPSYILAKPYGTAGRVVCETKRIRSHYLLPDKGKASQAFPCPSAKRQGLAVHYQCCDYASLWSRSSGPTPFNRDWLVPSPSRGSRSHRAGPRRWHIGLTRPASASRRRYVWGPGSNPR